MTSRSTRALSLLLAGVMSMAALLFSSGIASAHAYLRSTDPADGSTVPSVPATVSLEFNETIQNFAPALVVTGPDGKTYNGAATVLGNTVSTPVMPGGPSGAWTMAYRVVSADGHPVSAELHFTVAAGTSGGASGGTSGGAATSTTTSSGGAATSTTTSGSAGASTAAADSVDPSITGASAVSTASVPSSAGVSNAVPESGTSPGQLSESTPRASAKGTDHWVWIGIGVAALLLVAAGFIALRRPRQG